MKRILITMVMIIISLSIYGQTTRAQIKTYFQTGDFPTQGEFYEWIDSYYHIYDGEIVTTTNTAGETTTLTFSDNTTVTIDNDATNELGVITLHSESRFDGTNIVLDSLYNCIEYVSGVNQPSNYYNFPIGGGSEDFDGLKDTPKNKDGNALMGVRVNIDETALEYYDIPSCVGIIYDKGNFQGIGSSCDTIFIKKEEYVGSESTYNIANIRPSNDTIYVETYINLNDGLQNIGGVGTKDDPMSIVVDLLFNDSETIDFTQQQTAIWTAAVDTSVIATQYDIDNIVVTDTSGTHHAMIDLDIDPTNELFDSTYVHDRIDSLANVEIIDELWNHGMTQDITGNSYNLNQIGFINQSLTGQYSSALGDALNGTFTGKYNIGIGKQSGASITSGSHNIFNGYRAGYNITSGNYNVLLGSHAGYKLTDDSYAVMIGSRSGQNTESRSNVFIGNATGFLNQTGEGNLYMGVAAGYYNNGSGNVIIGDNGGSLVYDVDNSVMIGYQVGKRSTSDNSIFIGNRTGQDEVRQEMLKIGNKSTESIIEASMLEDWLDVNGKLNIRDVVDATDNHMLTYNDITDNVTKRLISSLIFPETDPIFTAWDKDYDDLINTPILITNNNQLTNGANYITGYTETDPIYNINWSTDAAGYLRYDAQNTTNGVRFFNTAGSQLFGISDYGLTNGWITATSNFEFLNPTLNNAATQMYVRNSNGTIGVKNISSITPTETDPIFTAWDKNYYDLINKPTIPTNNIQLVNGAGYLTTGDNLGNHEATANIHLNGRYLSNDGGNEGIYITNSGGVVMPTLSTSSATKIVGVDNSGSLSEVTLGGDMILAANSMDVKKNHAVMYRGGLTTYAPSTTTRMNLSSTMVSNGVSTNTSLDKFTINQNGYYTVTVTFRTYGNDDTHLLYLRLDGTSPPGGNIYESYFKSEASSTNYRSYTFSWTLQADATEEITIDVKNNNGAALYVGDIILKVDKL